MKTQAQTGTETDIEIAIKLRDLVIRQTIDLIAHELVHFIQDHNTVKSPVFLSEVAAIYIQENISRREELFQLAGLHTMRKLPLFPWLKECEGSWVNRPPIPPLYAHKINAAIIAELVDPIDFEHLLLMNSSDFYSQPADKLEREYNIATMLLRYLMEMPRANFVPLMSEVASGASGEKLKAMDRAFHVYIAEFSRRWFDGHGSGELESRTIDLINDCLDHSDFISAYFGSWRLVVLHPKDPRWLVYVGDVFFNGDRPYFAFDYFTYAYSLLSKDSDPAVRVMVTSRLGDAYQILGDVELAAGKFQESSSIDASQMPLFVTLISSRDKIKHAYYEIAKTQQRSPQEISPLLVEMYVHALQRGRCSAPKDKAESELISNLVSKGNEAEARSRLATQTALIIERMRKELVAGDWQTLLQSKLQQCDRGQPRAQ